MCESLDTHNLTIYATRISLNRITTIPRQPHNLLTRNVKFLTFAEKNSVQIMFNVASAFDSCVPNMGGRICGFCNTRSTAAGGSTILKTKTISLGSRLPPCACSCSRLLYFKILSTAQLISL